MKPGQSTLIRTMDWDTGTRIDHVVPRERSTQTIQAFRDAGFVVVFVQHNYVEGAHR